MRLKTSNKYRPHYQVWPIRIFLSMKNIRNRRLILEKIKNKIPLNLNGINYKFFYIGDIVGLSHSLSEIGFKQVEYNDDYILYSFCDVNIYTFMVDNINILFIFSKEKVQVDESIFEISAYVKLTEVILD